jgi:hypothetical protein
MLINYLIKKDRNVSTIYLFNGQKFTTEWTIQKSISNIPEHIKYALSGS